jgi:hypothetical protein
MEFKFHGDAVTLMETRPAFRQPDTWVEIPIAQFRRAQSRSGWKLYSCDQHQKWHLFKPHPDSLTIEELLGVVDEDTTGVFFG